MNKITKKQAKKYFDNGQVVIFCPSKCGPQSMLAVIISKTENLDTFDNAVNHFSYYNCSKTTGLTVHFYRNNI